MERKFLVTRNLRTCCYLGVIHREVVLFLGNSWKLCLICHYLNQKILQVDSWWDLYVQQLSYKIPRVLVYPLHETQGGPKNRCVLAKLRSEFCSDQGSSLISGLRNLWNSVEHHALTFATEKSHDKNDRKKTKYPTRKGSRVTASFRCQIKK